MTISTQVTFDLPVASSTQLGGVAVQSSSGLLVDSSGDLSVDNTQFLSVTQAASTYAPLSSSVSTINISLPYQDVTLDNTTSLFIINNPTSQVSGSSPATYHNAFINTLTLPSPVSDRHTFSITCTSGAGCSVINAKLSSSGSTIVYTTDGLVTLNQVFYTSGNAPTFEIPGTYRWVASTSTWYQVS
jgi:hypothetical protein